MAAKTATNKEVSAPVTKRRLSAVAGAVTAESADAGRLLYDRIRLGIMSALSVNQKMTFGELRDLLETTDGNLSKHARRLEEAGLVRCKKGFAERVPRTHFSMTAKGKRIFARHLEHMEALINAARK